MKMSDVRLYASKVEARHSDHRQRRYPRFAVPGLTLDLGGRRQQRLSAEVRDIGYGGLSFTYAGDRLPGHLEGEVVQKFSSEAHPVSMRPVSVVPLRGGRLRVGCAYEH
jgi:hypothetical protein